MIKTRIDEKEALSQGWLTSAKHWHAVSAQRANQIVRMDEEIETLKSQLAEAKAPAAQSTPSITVQDLLRNTWMHVDEWDSFKARGIDLDGLGIKIYRQRGIACRETSYAVPFIKTGTDKVEWVNHTVAEGFEHVPGFGITPTLTETAQ